MSLTSALPTYKSSLVSTFSNVGSPPTLGNSPSQAATEISNATQSWAISGIPMTVDTGTPPISGLAPGQVVTGGVTSTPGSVTADGLGGIDVSSPGSGLSVAKPTLISNLTTVFSNTNNSYNDAAQGITDAINSFFSQAKIMTMITGIIPPGVPVPPPAGPVGVGSYTGSGIGGIDSSSAGPGFSSTISSLISSLTSAFGNTNNTPAQIAQDIADYMETFFLSGTINTTNSGTAGGGPAIVAVPPLPPNGVTSPPGSPSSGTSSAGTIS